jgi:hypothetical protein
MKVMHRTIFLILLFASGSCFAADQKQKVYYLRLPASEAKLLGQIDKLDVTVTCSWIAGLRNVPELYEINIGYDIPSENVFDAKPRLGAAAVDLSHWSGVVGVYLPPDADGKSCFKVTVVAEGRTGATREWSGVQLGLPK